MNGRQDKALDAPPEVAAQVELFRRSLAYKVRAQEIAHAVGSAHGKACLDIGSDNGMLSCQLRTLGGKWQSAVTDPITAQCIQTLAKEGVVAVEDLARLPFKKHTFDLAVIVNFPEGAAPDEAFIEECHRVLKPEGMLVVNVPRQKKWSVIWPLRRMMKLTGPGHGLIRTPFTESELFRLLKHGFDVYNMRSYSRFFMELTDTLVRGAGVGPASPAGRPRAFSLAGVFYWLAFQLDLLLLFTRGYYLIAEAKRRAWRPRNAPVLADGRSITEAVLSKAGG